MRDSKNPVDLANELIESVIDSSQEIEHGTELACHKTAAVLFTCTGKALDKQDRLDTLLAIHGHVMTLQELNEKNRTMWDKHIDTSSYSLPAPNFGYLKKATEAALEAIENEVAQ